MFTTSSPPTRSPSLEPIATAATLGALRPEWEQLWRDAGGSPFQSPAWLVPWWKHIGRGELAGAAVRDSRGGELIGLAPLYVYRDEHGMRHLFPLGIATTDHIDMLAAPGREDEVAQAIATHVHELHGAWDVLEVPQLSDDALWLRCRWPGAWSRDVSECEPNPVLPLPARVPEAMAANVAYCRRRAAREYEITVEIADATNISATLDALAKLHAKRWSRQELPGVLGEPGVLDWHREAAPQLHEQRLLRLLVLRFGGRIVAVLYCLADASQRPHRRWHDYIGGFDPDVAAFSPGALVIAHAIGMATEEGAAAFDFLRGAEPYKYRWGAIDQPLFALRVRP
jgi:CelD/BcsL family acetyltransferase involved in cellulose biosynthesis